MRVLTLFDGDPIEINGGMEFLLWTATARASRAGGFLSQTHLRIRDLGTSLAPESSGGVMWHNKLKTPLQKRPIKKVGAFVRGRRLLSIARWRGAPPDVAALDALESLNRLYAEIAADLEALLPVATSGRNERP